MGQDDIGLIINSILPDFDFPIYEDSKLSYDYMISKTLSCNIIRLSEIEKIRKANV